MNWNKILKKCPKAVNLMTDKAMFNTPILFLDRNGLFVMVIKMEDDWFFDIWDGDELLDYKDVFKNREDAESAGKTAGFYLLEERL